MLADQDSTNGTDVNGQLVKKRVRIKDGDAIRLAKLVTLRFRCSRDEPPPSSHDLSKTTVIL